MGSNTETLDCLIIGGGPAGLLAAIYFGRYRRHVQLIDAGESRAAKARAHLNGCDAPDVRWLACASGTIWADTISLTASNQADHSFPGGDREAGASVRVVPGPFRARNWRIGAWCHVYKPGQTVTLLHSATPVRDRVYLHTGDYDRASGSFAFLNARRTALVGWSAHIAA